MPMRPWLRLSRSSKLHRLRRQISASHALNTNTLLRFYSENRPPPLRSPPHQRTCISRPFPPAYPAELLEETAGYRRGGAGHGRREC